MKYMLMTLVALALMGLPAAKAYAAPNPNNPNVVAYYKTGPHTIPMDPQFTVEGADLVMANGKSGNFNQWYWSDDIGYHSIWNMHKKGTGGNGVVIEDAYPGWGDYMVPGADYTVMTNEFHP